MNEYRMNWWIMNVRMVVLAIDLGWLNKSDRFTWAWRDYLGNPLMRENIHKVFTRKPWSIFLRASWYAQWDTLSCKGPNSKYKWKQLVGVVMNIYVEIMRRESFMKKIQGILVKITISYELRRDWEASCSLQIKELTYKCLRGIL